MAAEAGTFDYIAAGAGSAGCVVAARLSESDRYRVLLLEAGAADRNPWIHVPMGYARLFADPRVNWMYESEPEAELEGRTLYQPRGKVLGGTSSINGMVYMRISTVHLRPDGRGSVRLTSLDPLAPPAIRFNFLRTPYDFAALTAGIRLARRRIARQPVLSDYVAAEILPGAGVENEADFAAAIQRYGLSNLHPVGTCRMGGRTMPSSIRASLSTASAGCGLWTPRSCPRSRPATPTRRPS